MEKNNARNPGESGQMLILFVLGLGVLLGMVAMSVDVGLILHDRREMQKAADAAALAAAQELPASAAKAKSVAEQYAVANGVDLTDSTYTLEVTTPHAGDPNKVEVRVTHNVSFVFGRVLGLGSVQVPARAVADSSGGGVGGGYAIFVTDSDCSTADPLLFSGSDVEITGAVHSNSGLDIPGSDNSFNGPVTYSCDYEVGGQNNTFTSGPSQAGNRPSPLNYTYSSFPCTYTYTEDTNLQSRPEAWLNGDSTTKQLNPGVYCSTQDLQLSGQGISGNVTLVAADELKISGSDFNLSGYYNDVLAFSGASVSKNGIDISGGGGSFTGYINALGVRIAVQGSANFSVSGSIVSDKVTISGSNFTINSEGFSGPSGPASVRLAE